MSKDIEEIARAICRAHLLDDGYSQETADRAADGDVWKNFRAEAQAAYSVMEKRLAWYEERLAETQMLAFKWMEAHDKLHAGKPYEFPKPSDLPDALKALNNESKPVARTGSENPHG